MATEQLNEDGVPQNLRKQLAFAVKSIQWSYAIFWSISSRQPGVLEWGDGYYNGDIKTRKTVQAVETNADQRTEQLRELYECLSAAETNPQTKRPSAALSPEDLSDTEWYFLVCMSFVFNIGQRLPGKALETNQTVWLCNAHNAESKVFSRSLLAKSASIQTVVCFPHVGGVIELGVTELVLDDPNLVQHIKTYFLETPCPILTNMSEYDSRQKLYNCVSANARTTEDFPHANLDDFLDTTPKPVVECEEVYTCSLNYSSNGFQPNRPAEESYMVDVINGGTSQVQSRQFMDDEISNSAHSSMNSSDCISQTFVKPEKGVPLSDGEKVNHESNWAKLASFDSRNGIHYQSILSTILKCSHQLILGRPWLQNCNKGSSFVGWKEEVEPSTQMPRSEAPQKLLKKVLFEVARRKEMTMHGDCLAKSREDNDQSGRLWRPEADDIDVNHVLSEGRRSEKENERFLLLGSLVPSTGKVGKESILDDTIKYLKELKRRVEELESCQEVEAVEERRRRKSHDHAVERTSDNYGNKKIGNSKKPLKHKRKVCDADEMEPESHRVPLSESSTDDDVTVSVIKHDVLIKMKCAWRESLLLEILDTINNLNLDSHTVQSSNIDGILSLTIKSKLTGSAIASTEMIKQALQRIIG
ncbi:unnamed protein product [Ilex paraguariensis]|uniref:BHLH domain-containing protein n=1 Tax=Ilex paraguariensis TaxID=185542 RepID=A0ABC8SP35_9AQUA